MINTIASSSKECEDNIDGCPMPLKKSAIQTELDNVKQKIDLLSEKVTKLESVYTKLNTKVEEISVIPDSIKRIESKLDYLIVSMDSLQEANVDQQSYWNTFKDFFFS